MGSILFIVALALAVSAVIWWFLQFRGNGEGGDSPATKVLGIITAVLAVAALVFTVLAGHTGAESVWSKRAAGAYAGDTTPSTTTEDGATADGKTPAESATPETGGTSEDEAQAGTGANSSASASGQQFTLEEVALNNTASSCWAVVDGSVYDLTTWIAEHPGGPRVIERLCGTDATSAFTNQHSGNSKATGELDQHIIGQLVG